MTNTVDILNAADTPIPVHKKDPAAIPFRRHPVDCTQQRSDEVLVRTGDYLLPGESYYARTDGINVPYYKPLPGAPEHIWVRKGVAELLRQVNSSLEPLGLEVYLWDGYRTTQCQKAIYDWMIEHTMKARGITDFSVAAGMIKDFISDPSDFDPSNPLTWISHITGGAVDLTLRRRDNHEHLFMGSVFDDPTDVSHADHFEIREHHTGAASDIEAMRNRRILYHAMISHGFSSLPSEWWHFDWGDQLWMKNRPRNAPGESMPPAAWYGPAREPEGLFPADSR